MPEITNDWSKRTEALRSLLESNNFEQSDRNKMRSLWSRGDAALMLPERDGSDFDEFFDRAVSTLDSELGGTIDVRWHIDWPLHDRVQARILNVDSVALNDAVSHSKSFVALIEAGAMAYRTSRELTHFGSGSRPHLVRDYLSNARFLPTAYGSFVSQAALPLPTLAQHLHGEETYRSFSASLPRILRNAADSAQAVLDGEDEQIWNDAAGDGVSANLCKALAEHMGLREDGIGSTELDVPLALEMKVDFSPMTDELVQPLSEVIEFSELLAPVLLGGSHFLRSENTRGQFRITGYISKLSRSKSITGPGRVSVRGLIEGWDLRERVVEMEVDENVYHNASMLHETLDGGGKLVYLYVEAIKTRSSLRDVRLVDLEAVPDKPLELGGESIDQLIPFPTESNTR